ncbi:TPA_asm: terminase large subunit [Caudoviricetes sp. vir519]|nr:TPA_asm: terminase large subunit [Caudoviricetes sp. vir519]
MTSRLLVAIGGIGWGKTSASVIHYLKLASEFPGTTGVVVVPTYTMFEDVLLTEIEKWSTGIRKFYHQTKHRLELINGSEILFRVGETKRQIERLRGTNIQWWGLEEAALLSKKVFEIMLGRLRESDWGQGLITTTPKGRNWIFDLVNERQRACEKCMFPLREDLQLLGMNIPKNAQVTRYRGNDFVAYTNIPTFLNLHLPLSYLQDLLIQYAGKFARQELWGEFIALAGLVYDCFDFDKHVISKVSVTPVRRWGVIDWGFTNPTCIHVYGWDGKRLILEDEVYQSQLTADDVAIHCKEFQDQYPGIERWFADPEDPASIETLRRDGLNVERANNDLIGGIKRTYSWIRNDRIRVLKHCQGLQNELGLYAYPDTEEKNVEKPIDKFNHACDCLRYMVNELEDFVSYTAKGIPPRRR